MSLHKINRANKIIYKVAPIIMYTPNMTRPAKEYIKSAPMSGKKALRTSGL